MHQRRIWTALLWTALLAAVAAWGPIEADAAASKVLASSEQLGRQAESLRGEVDGFFASIRAA